MPVAVVITKCDLVDPARLEAVAAEVRSLLSLALPGLRPRQPDRKDDEGVEVSVQDTSWDPLPIPQRLVCTAFNHSIGSSDTT